MAEQFKPGDLVQLKSGGPVITVKIVHATGMDDEECSCEWFSGSDVKQWTFRSTELKSVASPSVEVKFVTPREF